MAGAPGVQWVDRLEDIDRIAFSDGVAAVMVRARLLRRIPFKNDERGDSPRLRAVMDSIREHGYRPRDPIIARVGQRGKWVVVDGGHRLTALRLLADEFMFRVFGPRLGYVYFLLFTTRSSWRKVRSAFPHLPEAPPGAVAEPPSAAPGPGAAGA